MTNDFWYCLSLTKSRSLICFNLIHLLCLFALLLWNSLQHLVLGFSKKRKGYLNEKIENTIYFLAVAMILHFFNSHNLFSIKRTINGSSVFHNQHYIVAIGDGLNETDCLQAKTLPALLQLNLLYMISPLKCLFKN